MVHTFRWLYILENLQHRRSLQVRAYIKGDAEKSDNL